MSALGHKGHFAMRERCPPCPRKRTFAVQKQMSVDMSRKAAPVAAFRIMWLTTAGAITSRRHFPCIFPYRQHAHHFCSSRNLPCLFFWHQQVLWRAWPLPRQRAILQTIFIVSPRECCRSTFRSVATCTKSNKAEYHLERRLSPCGLAGF